MPHPEWTLFHLLENAAEREPTKLAVVDGARRFTYADLQQQSSRLARGLLDAGLKRGDRVGIWLEKSWEALLSMTAVVHAGGVYVNINPQLKSAQVSHIMRNCQVRMLIAEAGFVRDEAVPAYEVAFVRGDGCDAAPGAVQTRRLEPVLASGALAPATTPAKEEDLGTIIYTSGSTGMPKGIMLTHHNIVVGAQIVSTYLENTADDRVLSVLPLNFDVGMNQFTCMLRVGGTLVVQHSLLPGEILKSLRAHEITGLAGVPGVWALLVQNRKSLEREPLTKLRYISNTGGMIPGPHLDELKALLKHTKIFLMYGLTEAFRSTFLDPREVHRGSACIGKAIPNTDIWVVRPDGSETAADEVGELIHRGPTVALGYWGDPEKTNAVYRPNPFAPPETMGRDQVVYSGDLVRRDAAGFLYYEGRRDEQIKTQGYRVSPLEIEELVHGTGLVHECAAFGKKDDFLGQRIVVVCSLKPGVTAGADEIRTAVAKVAPAHLVPQDLHFLPEIPKNPNGKIDRSHLRHEYASTPK
jgi:acyl-CoA ligase (AMP-forming) (exosortase A-associated)